MTPIFHAPIDLRRSGYRVTVDGHPDATAAYRRLRRGGTSPDAARMTVTNLLALGKHATLANFARTEQHA